MSKSPFSQSSGMGRPFFQAFSAASKHSSSLHELIFHLGYQGWMPPRSFRKVIARSSFHRAWLSGFTGLGILSIVELTRAE